MKFSIRSLLIVVLIVGLICGLLSSWQTNQGIRKRYEQKLQYSKEELARLKDQLRDLQRGKRPDRTRLFWEAELEGSELVGITIASDSNAFQKASFRKCNLERANLTGGGAAFQSACFDEANLKGAKLVGEGSSFQRSSFVMADLTGATLSGGPASFQSASFEDAKLFNAKLIGNFQVANISGAQFQGADLSAIEADNLASCYFENPPTYNSQTKFPIGFDPRKNSWMIVD